jgi:hypothetical protein
MKKILLLFLLLLTGQGLYAQNECGTAVMATKIDSILKTNNFAFCEVNFNYPNVTGGASVSASTRISSEIMAASVGSADVKITSCFLIVNNTTYFDLSKLLYFRIVQDKKTLGKNIIFVFQGF